MALWLKRRGGRWLLDYVAKGGTALVPYDADGEEEFLEIPPDRPLKVSVHVLRDPVLPRIYHAIVTRVAKGMGKDKEGVDRDLRVYAGYCDTYFVGDYEVKVPRTLSEIEGCDELKFRAYFDAAMLALTLEPFNIDPAVIEEWTKRKPR